MGFQTSIKRFNRDVDKKSLRLFRSVALAASDKVTSRTPIDTGAARGAWMAGINKPVAESEGYLAVINRLKLGDTFFLTNKLPYIRRLEYGWSQQAPAGMVRITVAEFQGIVKSILIRG
ncbi:MAG: HK97 gp10 family phage protein [Candidatus Sabulitectum sp.]|nr:HK97 gp10 family phage protein [Candidatus Sabulitectum sp.]